MIKLYIFVPSAKDGGMEEIMRIALINENSQAAKNAMVYENLKKAADAKGYEVVN